MIAPRRLAVVGGISPQGKKVKAGALQEAFAFTAAIYKLLKSAEKLSVSENEEFVTLVGGL